ncbi:MAG: SDR family NAD(P)-dependent oxidoreductase [Chitinophagaceae bacterium]
MKSFAVIGGSTGIGRSLIELLQVSSNVIATYNNTNDNSWINANVRFIHHNVLEGNLNPQDFPTQLDGLAYCVGAINLKPFARATEQDFIKDYQLQVLGAIKAIQALLPNLKAASNASIVLFSTVAVQTGFNFHSIVSASKGAIEGLTKALAAELAPKIRINCIAPSITQTPLANSLLNTPEKIEANALRHPLKKVGQPQDVAALANFLLNDEASWITGQIFGVDGGMSSIK